MVIQYQIPEGHLIENRLHHNTVHIKALSTSFSLFSFHEGKLAFHYLWIYSLTKKKAAGRQPGKSPKLSILGWLPSKLYRGSTPVCHQQPNLFKDLG